MTPEPVFLTPGLVLDIHARMIADFGGDPGLRDRGLLEAAVAMPRATFNGARLHRDLPEMAAAYQYHLSQNHPFVDGNKRVALVAALVFLSLNGLEVEATDEELGDLAEGLAAGEVDKWTVVAFYRDRVKH